MKKNEGNIVVLTLKKKNWISGKSRNAHAHQSKEFSKEKGKKQKVECNKELRLEDVQGYGKDFTWQRKRVK